MKINWNKLVAVTGLIGVIALGAGCASSGYSKAGSTATSVQKAAGDIEKGIAQIDVALAALSDLINTPGADLKPQFKKFATAVHDLESVAKDVGSKEAGMKSKGAEYFKTWDAELAKIQNEDIRSRSASRKDEVMKKFDRLNVTYQQAKTAFDPFIADLKDIRTALSTDLTTGGLAAIKSVAAKSNKDAAPLRSSMTELATQFKDLGVSLSSNAPQSLK